MSRSVRTGASFDWQALLEEIRDVPCKSKISNKPLVQSSDQYAFLTSPVPEVFRRSDVLASSYLCVARLAQLLGKLFE